MKEWVKNLDKINFEKGEYSQYFQDQLLEYIFNSLNLNKKSNFCVEFGYSTNKLSDHGNTTGLIKNHNWDYILFDIDYENEDINLYKEFLTTDNIIEVFKKYSIPIEPEYISIDVDSTDFWLFKELLTKYKPLVYSVEYNPNFPITEAITFPNDYNLTFNNDRAYGTSLKALTLLAESNNYSLLWVVPTLDAFFIRNDLIDDNTDYISYPISKFKSATNIPVHSRVKELNRLNNFINYEAYVSSNGDLEYSSYEAQKICKKYLVQNGDIRSKFMYFRNYFSNFISFLCKRNKIRKINWLHKFLVKTFEFISPFPYNAHIHKLI